MKKIEKHDEVKIFLEKKKIPRQIKDQLNPMVQKLMKICSSVKVLNRQAEWEEIEQIFYLLKSIQSIEAKYQTPHLDRSKNWKTFYNWCSENGAEFASVTVKEINDGNYGVYATKKIKEEEMVLTVPRKIMMTEETAKNSKLASVISSDPILKNMPNVRIAMHLLTELLNSKSFWSPYISILPSSYNTLLYFTLEEMKELQGSPVIDEVFNIFRSVVRQYCYFFQLFQKEPAAVSLNIGPYFTFELYRWAVSSVMTRQNIIPLDEDQMSIALIPLFDMCNHANGKLTTDFNLETDSLVTYSNKAVSQDHEVFMFYGPRTNGEFFVHNGFVYPENENDAVEIKLGISKNDSLHSLKCKVCNQLNISTNGPFYTKNTITKELLSFIKVNVMKQDELEKLLSSVEDQFDVLLNDHVIEARAISFLKDRLFLLLKSYKTTLQEDEKILKQDVFESEHQHLAFLLRFCEKKLLFNSLEYCKSYLETSCENILENLKKS